jgi:transcriptional regulator with XRE-family HTH domain
MPNKKPLPYDPAELRRVREAAGISSQEELSLLMGCGRTDVCAWENGRRRPGLERLMKLAGVCGAIGHFDGTRVWFSPRD